MSHIAVYFYILNTQYQQLDVRLQRLDGIVEKENIQWQHFQNLIKKANPFLYLFLYRVFATLQNNGSDSRACPPATSLIGNKCDA